MDPKWSLLLGLPKTSVPSITESMDSFLGGLARAIREEEGINTVANMGACEPFSSLLKAVVT